VELLDEQLAGKITSTIESPDWVPMKLSRLVRFVDGDRSSEYPSDNDLVEGGIPFFSSKQIKRRSLSLVGAKSISKEKFDRLGRGKLQDGDIIITVRGTLGNSAIFRTTLARTGFINAQLMIMRPRGHFEPELLHFFTRSMAWERQIAIEGYGSAQKQLNQDILRRFVGRYPLATDADHWKGISGKLISSHEKIVASVEVSVERLREFGSALITAAVTGQIDVATCGKHGATDRHLDDIEANMVAAAHSERQQVRA
jgi:type I restriction enzyme S subunit